jgi:alpha-D-ribose 1-methylphosphonate 5-triphosphate synthase subunit PhnH
MASTPYGGHNPTDPVLAAQSAFRAALDAIAHPGSIVELPSAPDPIGAAAPATLALLLSLADGDTPVWLDPAARSDGLPDHLRFHCGCPIVDDPARSAFALIVDAASCPPFDAFDPGTPEFPDRSTTLILQVAALSGDRGARLSGPGIESVARLDAAPLPADFWAWVAANNAGFPLGVDIFLAAERQVAALPRSVTVED